MESSLILRARPKMKNKIEIDTAYAEAWYKKFSMGFIFFSLRLLTFYCTIFLALLQYFFETKLNSFSIASVSGGFDESSKSSADIYI